MSEENIVSYTTEQLKKMPDTHTDWARVNAMTEEEIEQNALDDPDNPPWTEEELKYAIAVVPAEDGYAWEAPGDFDLRAQLGVLVIDIIKERGLSRKEAQKILKIDHSKLSLLLNKRLLRFSIEKLMEFVTLLGQDLEIKPKGKISTHRQGKVTLATKKKSA